MSDSGASPHDSDVGGLGAPLRRLRAMTARERLVTVTVCLVSALAGGAAFWLLGRLVGDDEGWPGFIFFAVFMFLVTQYQPELTRLVRRMND